MNDRTTLALAEALREHDHDIAGELPAGQIIRGAKRNRRRRRIASAAGSVAAVAVIAALALGQLPGRNMTTPSPADPSVDKVSSAEPSPTQVENPQAKAYAWASALPEGSAFEPYDALRWVTASSGRVDVSLSGRTIPLGDQPSTVLSAQKVGRNGENLPATWVLVTRLGTVPGSTSDQVVWVVSEDSAKATELWRGDRVLDLLGGLQRVALMTGNGAGSITGIELIDFTTGQRQQVTLPPGLPLKPRFATWKGNGLTVVDGHEATAQAGPGVAPESSAMTYDTKTAAWTTGTKARWFGAAPPPTGEFDGTHNIVMVAKGEQVCAHVMDGASLQPTELGCATALRTTRAPAGTFVLIEKILGEGSGTVPSVIDLNLGVAVTLPVGELNGRLRWETSSALVGAVPNESGSTTIGFRIDLSKSALHQRLPEAPPPAS